MDPLVVLSVTESAAVSAVVLAAVLLILLYFRYYPMLDNMEKNIIRDNISLDNICETDNFAADNM